MVERIREGDIPGVQLRLRRELNAGCEEIWRRLTGPREAARWLAQRVDLRDDLGERLRWESDFEGGELVERVTLEESMPLRRWVVALERSGEQWPAPTRVTFELRATAAGTELAILHEGFQRLALSRCLTIWEFYRRRWRWAVDRLESEVEAFDRDSG
jgi:uncharacterized protein YndB with AHSA1/START domain